MQMVLLPNGIFALFGITFSFGHLIHEAHQILIDTMSKLAFNKDDPADLVNAAIEELTRQRYELPVYNTLKDAANDVRTKSYRAIYHRLIMH